MAESIDFQIPMKTACRREISGFCKDVPHGHARVIRSATPPPLPAPSCRCPWHALWPHDQFRDMSAEFNLGNETRSLVKLVATHVDSILERKNLSVC